MFSPDVYHKLPKKIYPLVKYPGKYLDLLKVTQAKVSFQAYILNYKTSRVKRNSHTRFAINNLGTTPHYSMHTKKSRFIGEHLNDKRSTASLTNAPDIPITCS